MVRRADHSGLLRLEHDRGGERGWYGLMWNKRKWKKWRDKYLWLVLAGGAALLAGGILAWWWHVPEPPEAALTDTAISGGRQDLEEWARRVDKIAEQVRKEVTSIRENITSSVQALPPDSVAAGLNDELARFRLDLRPSGMDGD